MFQKIDTSKRPDGLLWTVVLMCGAQTFSRTRFVERLDADEYAHKLIREQHGCRVHIEGPEKVRVRTQ